MAVVQTAAVIEGQPLQPQQFEALGRFVIPGATHRARVGRAAPHTRHTF
ncbi:MAG: hypothetical protein LBB94_10805 [Clostridiales bacterium]|nr:hypothetical protein [Clostridiales bacterium]